MYKIKPSQFVQSVLRLNGQPFSLEGREWLYPIYDGAIKHMLLYTGRQVEKSTTLAGHMLSRVLLIPHFQALYVAPSSEQAKIFAHQKLDPFINTSEVIKKYYTSTKLVNRVFEKEFTNHSRIMLAYALLDADRIRGRSADALYLDEVQDMVSENIPIIEETLGHSRYKYKLYAGTPKHKQSPIEYYWNISTQTDWFVKCTSCGSWNLPGEEHITPGGLVCKKCGAKLDVRNGEWVDLNPNSQVYGLHISQLIVPWVDYSDIWWKFNNYPRSKFYNEVLGRSYDEANYSISVQDLMAASGDYTIQTEFVPSKYNYQGTYMGIDYSATTTDTGSYTVVAIGVFYNGKFRIIYMHRYMGLESDFNNVIEDVVRLAQKYRVKRIGADWGVGSGGANAQIRGFLSNLRGTDPMEELWEFYYSHNLKPFVKWDRESGKFILNRTESITNLILRIKERKIEFPKFEEWQDYAQDFLNIYLDFNPKTNKTFYNKAIGKPDDFVHAVNFAYVSALIDVGELKPTIGKVAGSQTT